ncbi:cupin domain-containing protein [Blastococcus sp. SYSU D00820]
MGGPTSEIGRRLAELRRGKRLSLRTVAESAGVSESFLSQVERGVANPSIASLHRIAAALGEPMAALFSGEALPPRLVRVENRQRMAQPFLAEEDLLLTPRDARRVQMMLSTIAAGQDSGAELYTHGGEEECVMVLEGELEIRLKDDTFHLGTGDVLLLNPQEPHGFRNPGGEQARVLWVTAPPPDTTHGS